MFGVVTGLVPQRSALEGSDCCCVSGTHQKRTWDKRGYPHAVDRGQMLLSHAADTVEMTGELVGEVSEAMGGA